MTISCPACGKANQGGPECPRCGCALAELLAVAAVAQRAEAAARRRLADRDWAGALAAAERSWRMRRSLAAARTGFLAAGAARNRPAAQRWHRRARAAEEAAG